VGHGPKLSFDHGHEKLQEQELNQGDNKEEKNHKKCKPKFNSRLKTQIHKAKTQYMLKDDLNKKLF
jgi:hypothetical protein